MRRLGRSAAVGALLVALGGLPACGTFATPRADPSATPYDGPLYLSPADAHTDAERLAGAAGRVVRCRTRLTGEFRPGRYEGGETGTTPQKGFQEGLDEGAFDGPRKGYTFERTEGERALVTFRVDGAPKMAVILHDGPALGAPSGWHLEAWARCDIAEFPASTFARAGTTLWQDQAGLTAPSYQVKSGGGGDCASGATQLYLDDSQDSYVRNPPADLRRHFFDEDWQKATALPADAYDTGFHQGDRHLWLSADRRRAYVGEVGAAAVEMWPLTREPIVCG